MKKRFSFVMILKALWKHLTWPFKHETAYAWQQPAEVLKNGDLVGHKAQLLRRGDTEAKGKVVHQRGNTVTVELINGQRKSFNRNHLLQLVKISR